jgi:phytoene synthase
VNTWGAVLDTAGITGTGLREDYAQARRTVAGFKREAYVAVRLLVPPALVPDVLAATAFMHHTDNLLDSGPTGARIGAYRDWEQAVRAALAGVGPDAPPLARALARSAARHPALRSHAEAFLDTALTDLEFAGFATEKDYQHYVDAYSLPALMVVACLLAPEADADAAFRAACRTYIDGSQRLDFVNDLAEDLAAGRLTVPEALLRAHRVDRTGLEAAADIPEVRALLAELLARARASLLGGRELVRLTPPANRPMVRALLGLDLLTLKAAEAKGPALLRSSARPALPAAIGLLLREHRARRALAHRDRQSPPSS